ncbi:regulator of G-protein signaling 14 isoform X1 [Tachysurus ichikawai]
MDASVSFQHRPNFTLPSRDKRAMPFQELTRGLSHFGLRASLRRRLGRNHTLTLSRPLILTKTMSLKLSDAGEAGGLQTLTVSDGGMDEILASKTPPVPVSQARRGAVDFDPSLASLYRSNPKQKNPAVRKAYDMEGLVELLNRAQCCSADDQRGLLKKEDLILPNFLQVPLEEHDEEDEQLEDERSADPLSFGSTENLGEPASNTKGDTANSSTSLLCSTDPADRKLTKGCSNPGRETVV